MTDIRERAQQIAESHGNDAYSVALAMLEEQNEIKAEAVEQFVNTMIGALESGFVEEGPVTLAEIYLFMRSHAKDNYGHKSRSLTEAWGEDVADLCAIGINKGNQND